MIALNKRFTSSIGIVAYDCFGSGPPVVLVHGTPTSSYIWTHPLRTLEKEWRVLLLDLPGYGQSEMTEGQDVRLRSQARMLAELLDHERIGDAHLVGHDFGAAVILGAVLKGGARARGLTIVDGVVLNPWGTPYSLLVKDNLEVFQQVPEYVHLAALSAHLDTAVSRPMDDVTRSALLAPWRGKAGRSGYYRQVAQYDPEFTANLELLYRKVPAPLSVIWGEDDQWVPVSEGKRFAAAVPNAQLQLLQDAGHFVMLDLPNGFTAALNRTLRSAA